MMHQGKIINLDASLALNAAKLGLDFKWPLADSMILSAARANNAIIWTQDSDFKGIDGVKYIPSRKK